MTKDEALELVATRWWEHCTDAQIVGFQLYERLLCMPFARFHEATEKALCRPVYTHEFGLGLDQLKAEFEGTAAPATLAQILDLIPPEKRIIGDDVTRFRPILLGTAYTLAFVAAVVAYGIACRAFFVWLIEAVR